MTGVTALHESLVALCRGVPSAIGAVLCDPEGETVVSALGSAPAPAAAEQRAREHVPRALELSMPVAEFLVRLAGAEPCALLNLFDGFIRKHRGGLVRALHFRYAEIELLVRRLPEDFYVVLVVRRAAESASARRQLDAAARTLAQALE